MLPSVSLQFPGNNFIFQQDNCPVHNARIVREWFESNNIETMLWPAKSPDLNVLENIWGLMTKKMYNINFKPENRDSLVNAIELLWDELSDDPELTRNLYLSIPRRLNKVLEGDGAITKY